MKPTSLMPWLAALVACLPAAAFAMDALPMPPVAVSGPELVGALLIGLLALGLRERDALDQA